VLLGHGCEAFVHELLQTPALVRLGRVDVALRIDGDAVHRVPLSGLAAAVAEAGQDLERLAIHHVNTFVLPVAEIHVLLLRILRERDVPRGSITERPRRDLLFLPPRPPRPEPLNPTLASTPPPHQPPPPAPP